jgi:hypothetical protein
MFGFALKSNKKKEPFQKFEGSFAADEVANSKPVTKQQAMKVAQGYMGSEKVIQANAFDKIFRQLVEMVTLKDGSVHFFELIDRKTFAEELQN